MHLRRIGFAVSMFMAASVGISACGRQDERGGLDSAPAAARGSEGGGGGGGGGGSGLRGLTSGSASDTSGGGGGSLRPLSFATVPRPQGDIVDRAAAIRLGKALFWDVQTGSDGQVACATCHFRGGADPRRTNSLHPGPDGVFSSGGVSGPGQTFLTSSIANDDRMGSQGVFRAVFVSIPSDPASAAESCTSAQTDPFWDNRSVTGRNAPTVIGAVFFRDLFWDGRAHHVFNGANPFGTNGNGSGPISIANAGLASQATGPAGSDVEMACGGRPFNGSNSLGAKLLARKPLQFQLVSPGDSVLGSLSASPGRGLRCGTAPCTYTQLISAAFGTTLAADAQNQFSRIWGQAVAAYEATLIPSRTPLDRFLAGDTTALTLRQQRGLDRFTGKGGCTNCHVGPELSDATVAFAASRGLINEDGGDQGFHNVGVRPTSEDPGRAGTGPLGVPWSVSGAAADRGAFKTPGLRNVKLSAPYFHNGGKATLADVVDFYDRGGDFPNPELSKRISEIGFSADDKAALVDFLTNGLTDCRTEKDAAPFDHPSLGVPNGPALPATGAGGTGPCP